MTSSRTKALLSAACALAWLAGAALAEAPNPGAPPAAGSAPAEPGIESQPLAVPEAQLIGLLDSEKSGFARDLWVGASPSLVEALLPKLPMGQTSPAMADLARRLLLSRADPPQGAGKRRSLLSARLERLVALGDFASVEPLAQMVPGELASAEVLAPRVDVLLYQGTDKEACALAERARGRGGEAHWTKRLAYCDALAGKVAEARMGVDVLAGTGDEDAAFASLMARLVDKAKVAEVSPEAPSAVHFALLRQTGAGLAASAIERASPGFLMAWAGYEKAPAPQRIAAGERAASAGVLSTTALLGLYSALPVKPQRLAAPYDGKPLAGAEGAAFAVQRVAISDDAGERAKLIAAALKSAQGRGVLPALASAFAPDLAAIPATDELAEMGATLATGEVLAGNSRAARRWLDIVRTKGPREGALALRSLLTVAGQEADLSWSASDMAARVHGAAPENRARAGLEWEIAGAFGLNDGGGVSPTISEGPLTMPGVAPIPAVLEGLEDASAQNHLGASVLYALAALGETGPRGAHPLAISAVVRALKRVGLDAEARGIAAEALAWRMP